MKETQKMIKNILKKHKGVIITLIIVFSLLSFDKIISNKKDTIITLHKESEKKITVYLKGAVKNEGIYNLEEEATLEDLLNISGGISNQADISKINLKKQLINGEIIEIKTKTRYIEIEDEKEKVDLQNDNTKQININTASKEELIKLKGIGEKTAQNIIDYRNNNRFNQIEDIKKVKGIGDKKYENIKNEICI